MAGWSVLKHASEMQKVSWSCLTQQTDKVSHTYCMLEETSTETQTINAEGDVVKVMLHLSVTAGHADRAAR